MDRRFVPWQGLSDQLGNPVGSWMIGYAQSDQASPFVPKDHQYRQQPEIDGRHHQEVHGGDADGVIAQECFPRLARASRSTYVWPYTWPPLTARLRSPASAVHHVCAVHPRAGSPCSSAGSGCGLRRGFWASRYATETSIASREARPVSAQHCLRLHDRDRAPQRWD